MPDDHRESLSPKGAARRDAMLADLLTRVPIEAARRRRRRSATRAGAAIAMVALSLGVWWWSAGAPATLTPQAPVASAPMQPAPTVQVAILGTTPGIAERFAVNPTVQAERIGDEELLELLDSIGQPTGLVRTPDRVYLTANIGEQEEAAERESDA